MFSDDKLAKNVHFIVKFDDSFVIGDALDSNGHIYFGNSPPIAWNTIERWNRTSDEAPDYTFYSVLTLKTYFVIFILSIICQTFTIFWVKKKWSQSFSRYSLLDKIIHCFENINIPHPHEEWDSGLGDARKHFKRMKQYIDRQ